MKLMPLSIDEITFWEEQGVINPDMTLTQLDIFLRKLKDAKEDLWLQENLSDLIAMIDTSMADYPEIGPIKNEIATSTIGWSSETELADEDWTRVRTALEAAIKQE